MYKSLQVAYWQQVHNSYRLRTSTMFNYRLGSGSRFNCRLYIGNGLKIITGYALAACSPATKCWHQVDPLQKRPMGAFSQFSALGEAHCPTLQTSNPRISSCTSFTFIECNFTRFAKRAAASQVPFAKSRLTHLKKTTKTLAQVLCFSTKRPYLAVCSIAQVLPFLLVFSYPRSKNYMHTLYKMNPL